MIDFNQYSNFNKDAGFSGVKFGSGATILETELNEMQDIQREKLRSFIRSQIGEGIYGKGSINYSADTFTLSNDEAIVDGNLLVISSLEINAVEGDSIYLQLTESEAKSSDTIKKYGNEQEASSVTNNILDPRVGTETSRRLKLTYNLSTVNTAPESKYLKLGSIVAGAFVQEANLIIKTGYLTEEERASWDNKAEVEYVDGQIALVTATGIPKLVSYTYEITATAGQTQFNIPLSTFVSDTDTVIVFTNTVLLPKSEYTINDMVGEIEGYVTTTEARAEGDLVTLLILKNVPIGADGSISGRILAVDSVPQDRVTGLVELNNRVVDIELPDTSNFKVNAPVKSVPTETVSGKAKNFSALGLTLVTKGKNMDFDDGTTGWAAVASTLTVSNKILSVEGDGVSNAVTAYTVIPYTFTQDNKLFWFTQARVTNPESTKIESYLRMSTSPYTILTDGAVTVPSPVQNKFYEIAGLATVPAGLSGDLRLQVFHQYADSASAVGKVMEINGEIGAIVVDLTSLGLYQLLEYSGHTTDSEKKEALVHLARCGFFSGMKSVENLKVESVGKNLFDKQASVSGFNEVQYYALNEDGEVIINALDDRSIGSVFLKYRVKRNTQYTLSNGSKATGYRVYGLDSELKGVEQISSATAQTHSFNSGDYDYIGLKFVESSGFPVILADIMLEEDRGQTLGVYEAYKHSYVTAQVPLRHVPDLTRDRVYVHNNELWLEKSIGEYALQSVDINTLITNAINYDRITIPRANIPKIYAQPLNSKYPNNRMVITDFIANQEYTSGAFLDSSNYVGTYVDTTQAGAVITLFVAKGTYANLADAQADLAGTVIQYALDTPEHINLTEQGLVDGELFAYENGTIYISSDTFHSTDISFDVPVNRGAQIDGLLESAEEQAKQIITKADKVQEDWIEADLLNGASGSIRYAKNDLGVVSLKINIVTGNTALNTVLAVLPVGYRVLDVFVPIPTINISTGTSGVGLFLRAGTGEITISGNTHYTATNTIGSEVSFYVGKEA